PDNRKEILEKNWERYITRGAKWMDPYTVDDIELTLCPFSEGKTWDETISPEEAGFICGFVTVPLFHDQPDGDTIQIPIAIWPDYDNPPILKPLFITHGGPGGSALEMYPRWFYPNRIGGQRDLVFIDQRGTRYADPTLSCPEVTESSREELEDYQDYLQYCRARLAGKGIDLNAFNTPEIARDIDLIRQVLDYSAINFYGVSYGSHVGQYLAAFYPERIRSLILDGVAPIPLDYLNRSVTTHDRILNEHINNCEQDPICAEQYPDLMARLEKTVDRLDKDPVTLRFQIPNSIYSITDDLNGEFFYNFILTSSYLEHSYASLPYIIQQSEENKFDSIVAFTEAYLMRDLVATGSYYAVICAEHSPKTAFDTNETILSPSMLRWEEQDQEAYQERCSHWSLSPPDQMLTVMPKSDVPTLLLSGLFDPVTPPEYGEIALKSFQRGQHLIDPIGSHGIAFSDSCTKSIVEIFLDHPEKPVNADCLDDPERKISTVPPEAISSSIIREAEDIYGIIYFVSALLIVVMILRIIFIGIRWLIKKKRGTLQERSAREKRLNRIFELASWIFIICNIGFGIGLDHFFNSFSEYPGYWQASALPVEARGVLIIPPLLILVLPSVVITGFMLWKYKKNVFSRSYTLLQALYNGGYGFYLISSGLLWSWMG
ncbi:MAG: alpha/beta fold hydrolase, partial [Anaerolineales bacterium]